MAKDTEEQLARARADVAAGVGTKADHGKPRWSLIPWDQMTEVARVYTFGASKYSDHNWRSGMKWTRMWDAAMRHMEAWMRGERLDPDSGIHHLAHAIFCLLACMWFEAWGKGEDDRWHKS